MKKRWKFHQYKQEEVDALCKDLNINPVFCELLVERGIKTFDAAKRFFRPDLNHLHDPFLMKDMDKAVSRLSQAIKKEEYIWVYGDYDVDGTTSAALMYAFLQSFHQGNLDYYIPDRYTEGYGLSEKAVEEAASKGVKLLITLDCGITAHAAIALANEKGIEVIVCDHHLPEEKLPAAIAILNPKQYDCAYPCKELSGCAVGFKLATAYALKNSLSLEEKVYPLLDFVALSLACDMVPLVDENRVLAFFGLQQFNETTRPGLLALRELLDRPTEYTVRDLSFGIGPLINAAGRMEQGSSAVALLLTKEKEKADALAQQLKQNNLERREQETEVLEQARHLLGEDPTFHDKKSIVLFQSHWHKGVLGIVATKLTEEFHRPTILLSDSGNGYLVGSARSVGQFDLHNAIAQCGHLLLNFGGHKAAAGIKLKPAFLEKFCLAFEQQVYRHLTVEDEIPTLYVDAQLEMKLIDERFWKILKQFAPFGPANQRPVFLSKMVRDTGYSKKVKDKHIKLLVRQGDSAPLEGVAFNFGEYFDQLNSRKPFHLCYSIEENHFRGAGRLQLLVEDMRF